MPFAVNRSIAWVISGRLEVGSGLPERRGLGLGGREHEISRPT
jgi:hypothetical protein